MTPLSNREQRRQAADPLTSEFNQTHYRLIVLSEMLKRRGYTALAEDVAESASKIDRLHHTYQSIIEDPS